MQCGYCNPSKVRRARRDALHTESSGHCAGSTSQEVVVKAASAACQPCPSGAHTVYVPEQFVCMNECTQREPTRKVKRTELGVFGSVVRNARGGEKSKNKTKTKKKHTTRMTTNSKSPKRTPPSKSNRVPYRSVHCNSSTHAC